MVSIPNRGVTEQLIGLPITAVAISPGTVTLSFGSSWSLAIYNAMTVESKAGNIALGDGHILIGKSVLDVSTTTAEFVLGLTDGITVHVDLRDEAFTGPEAMQLWGPHGERVIWN